jgi:hypothetical protein
MKSNILAAALLLTIGGSANAALVQYYAFDGNTNATVGNSGTTTGTPIFYTGGGVNGDAVNLTNSLNYIETTLSGVFADSFSVSFFARANVGTWRNWWAVSTNGTSDLVRAEIASDGTIDLYGPSFAWVGPDTKVAWVGDLGSAWFHHAYVFDGSEVRVYVNGVLDDTYTSWAETGSITDLRINTSWQYNNQIDADYDEFAVFSEVLSAAQIAQLASGVRPTEIPEPTSASLLGLGALALIRRRKRIKPAS